MRYFYCEKCIQGRNPGTRMIYPESNIGEPAEFERVVIGIAKIPQQSQRWMSINGDKQNLPVEFYNCDMCGREVKPGEKAGARSIWTGQMPQVPEWEDELLEIT